MPPVGRMRVRRFGGLGFRDDRATNADLGHAGADAHIDQLHRVARHAGDLTGQVFALLILTVAAAEAAIGLAIVVIYFRNRGSIQVEDVNLMRG